VRNCRTPKIGMNCAQYGAETAKTAVLQNSFVGGFETTPFSQNAAG
jgi:hypothetical protein